MNRAHVRDMVRRCFSGDEQIGRSPAWERIFHLRRVRRSQIARYKGDTNGQPIGKNMWMYR